MASGLGKEKFSWKRLRRGGLMARMALLTIHLWHVVNSPAPMSYGQSSVASNVMTK